MTGANHSFAPEPHFLVESLRAQTRFHDPTGESLFSHTGTAEGYRAWSTNSSGRNSPISYAPPNTDISQPAVVPTLLVRSSRPFAMPPSRNANAPGREFFNHLTSNKVSEDCYEIQLPSLVTPRALDAKGSWKRIRYAVLEVRSPLVPNLRC